MKKLQRLRESCGLTRQQLGARAGVHPARVGAIENGRETPLPGSKTLQRLATALGLPVGRASDLLAEDER
jgi:transcriptional regulator with XRE-family HTH domain